MLNERNLPYVEMINRLKSATLEGKLAWEVVGSYGQQYSVVLADGSRVIAASPPAGNAVLFSVTDSSGAKAVSLNSAGIADELLRLAMIQLFVTVRDTLSRGVAKNILDNLRDL